MKDPNAVHIKGSNRVAKEVIVEEIKTKLDGANGIVLTDYQGLTHKQIEEMKKQLKAVNSTFAITKNTLLKISLSTSKIFADKIPDENLNAPTATLFISGDPVEALKILQKLNKDTGLPKIKVGVIDGATLDQAQIIKLSTLPNKQTLLTQLVGMLNSPIQGLVVVLNANIVNLALVLNAIAQNKPAATAPAPVEATPVAEAQPVETPTTDEVPASEPVAVSEATEGIGDAPTVDAVADAQVEESAPAETQPAREAATQEDVKDDQVSGGGENS